MGDAERRDESGRRISDLDRTVEWVFHELMPEIEQELIEKTDAPPTTSPTRVRKIIPKVDE